MLGMPRKRPHSTSSGSSVHDVHQIPSTQLEVMHIENEICSKLKGGKCKRPIKTSVPQLNRSTLVSSQTRSQTRPRIPTKKTCQADSIACVNKTSSNDITQRRLPPVDLRLLEPSTSNDLNENAARSGMCNVRKDRSTSRQRPRGRPRRRYSNEYTVIKVPVESILCAQSELTSGKRRKCRRKTNLRTSQRPKSVSQSNHSIGSYSSLSHHTRVSTAKNVWNKQKKRSSKESSPSSCYRVTPCPTDGACSSRGSYYSQRESRRSRRRSSQCRRHSGNSSSCDYSRHHISTGNYSHSNASISRTCCRNRTPEGGYPCEKSRSPIQSPISYHHGSQHRHHKRACSSSNHRSRRYEKKESGNPIEFLKNSFHSWRTSQPGPDPDAKNERISSRTHKCDDRNPSRSASVTHGNEHKSSNDRLSPGRGKGSGSCINCSQSWSGRSDEQRADSSTSRSRHASKKSKKKNTSSLMCTLM